MRYKFLFLIFLGYFQNAYGQSVKWPATWIEIGISKKINKTIKLEFTPELRYFEDLKLDSYILEGGLVFKVHKYLNLGTLYRFENEYKVKKDEFNPSSRMQFFAGTGFDYNRFKIQFRILYVDDLGIAPETNNQASYFRYKAKLDYDFHSSNLAPYIAIELYHDLIIKAIDKKRYTLGLSYSLKKNHEFSLFYRIQQKPIEMNTDHILGLSYEFKL
jgi:hypothetical protein